MSLGSRILTIQRIQIFWRISSGIQQETKLPPSTPISWSTFYPLGWVSQKDNGKKKITLLQPLFYQYAPGIDTLKNERISYFLACTWIPVSCILSLPLKFTSLSLCKIFIYVFGCASSQLWHMGSLIVVAVCGIFSCGMRILNCGIWDLAPWPGMESGPPALAAGTLSHWTTREVPCPLVFSLFSFFFF